MNIRAKIFGGAAEVPLLRAKRPKGAKGDELHSVAVLREWRQRRDSRGEDRHRLIGERAQLTFEGQTHEIVVINLSGGGAMIETSIEPLLWDRVHLHLGDHGEVECTVRWIRKGRIGLEFAPETRLDGGAREIASLLRDVIARTFPDAVLADLDTPTSKVANENAVSRIDPDSNPAEHRAGCRHPMVWRGKLYHDFQTTAVRIRNISETGAMIEAPDRIRIGCQPLLELSDAVSVSVTVMWAIGDQVGVSFNEPFDMSLLARSLPEVATTTWEPPKYLRKLGTEVDARNHWNHLTLGELYEELEGFLKR